MSEAAAHPCFLRVLVLVVESVVESVVVVESVIFSGSLEVVCTIVYYD